MIQTKTGLWPVLFLSAVFFLAGEVVRAENQHTALPAISIILDDMGKRVESGRRALSLPGPVAFSFLPQAPHTRELARAAYFNGKEVLLHLPMQSVDRRALDPGAVTLDMTQQQFSSMVRANLASVPHVSGINNHMGSLLTRHPGHMLWLMRVMQVDGPLFFVDSRTTVATVAHRVALENGVPSIERNVFLDHELDSEAIAFQFRRLLRLARKQGVAVAIGHPNPHTLSLLERQIPKLSEQGIRLLPVSELIDLQQEGEQTWQASWSPSHKGVKNSKPSL